ncbi:MAG TPA: ABC transporter permease [Terriglobales bacterium]|jgi:phospholipid/cholesterol/gamma-HCH transport system permease protein|nr:ABC transporter permease [Terriglobales bacterium]
MELELISPWEIAKDKIQAVQDYTLLSIRALGNLFERPIYIADTMQQADLIGVGSLPIVVLTGLSIGALLALNSANTLQRFGGITLIGQLVSIGMVTELGPLITGLMVAGRNASGMASELGSMIVTEQIDAMRALGTDPTKKLVTPRVIATAFMLFFLTIIADLLGLIGGNLVASLLFGLDVRQYWTSAWQILVFRDVFMGLIKPVLFGFVISTIGCYYGMSTRGGTQGVGRSTTQAVVASSVLILVVDFFVTKLIFAVLGYR